MTIEDLKNKCREYANLTSLTTTYTCEGWFRPEKKHSSGDEEAWDIAIFDEASKIINRENNLILEEAIEWVNERIKEHGRKTD